MISVVVAVAVGSNVYSFGFLILVSKHLASIILLFISYVGISACKHTTLRSAVNSSYVG